MTFKQWYNQHGDEDNGGKWWKDYELELGIERRNLESNNVPNPVIVSVFDTIYSAVSNQFQ